MIFTIQGVGNAVRRFVSQIAIILGPIWGSGTLQYPYVMLLVPLGLIILGGFLFLLTYSRLNPVAINEEEEVEEERQTNTSEAVVM